MYDALRHAAMVEGRKADRSDVEKHAAEVREFLQLVTKLRGTPVYASDCFPFDLVLALEDVSTWAQVHEGELTHWLKRHRE